MKYGPIKNVPFNRKTSTVQVMLYIFQNSHVAKGCHTEQAFNPLREGKLNWL